MAKSKAEGEIDIEEVAGIAGGAAESVREAVAAAVPIIPNENNGALPDHSEERARQGSTPADTTPPKPTPSRTGSLGTTPTPQLSRRAPRGRIPMQSFIEGPFSRYTSLDEERQNQVNELDNEIWNLADASRGKPEKLAALFLKQGAFKHNVLVAVGGEFYDFRNLQAANIVYLRQTLVTLSDKIYDATDLTPQDLKDVRETLHQYFNALRDIEYTFSRKEVEQADVQPGTFGPRTAEILFPKPKSQTGDGMVAPDAGTQRDISKLQLKIEDEEEKKKLLERRIHAWRVLVAGAAGVALIGPMLLMTLHPGKTTSLVTTSVAVAIATFVFGFVPVDPQSVFLGAAAYAAVLIVFVGASLAPESPTCICSTL